MPSPRKIQWETIHHIHDDDVEEVEEEVVEQVEDVVVSFYLGWMEIGDYWMQSNYEIENYIY